MKVFVRMHEPSAGPGNRPAIEFGRATRYVRPVPSPAQNQFRWLATGERAFERALAAMHVPARYKPVETDGAARAARRIAEVLENRRWLQREGAAAGMRRQAAGEVPTSRLNARVKAACDS